MQVPTTQHVDLKITLHGAVGTTCTPVLKLSSEHIHFSPVVSICFSYRPNSRTKLRLSTPYSINP